MKKKMLIALIVCVTLAAFASIFYLHRQASPNISPPDKSSTLSVQNHTATHRFDHIVIILEENKPRDAVIGNTSAPYINHLSKTYSIATNYTAVTHPSLPNYLALTSGTTAGITTDCAPSSPGCQVKTTNIVDRLEHAVKSWKEYAESMPAPCYATNNGTYAVRHNPFMYFPDITSDRSKCMAHVVPFTQFVADLHSQAGLPNYSFITPNLCNDMHDCSVQTGDAWLARYVPQILSSPTFTQQKSLLVITWDEGSSTDNTVPLIFAGSAAKSHGSSDASYSHYSLLHTIEANWGLSPMSQEDARAAVMNDMLR